MSIELDDFTLAIEQILGKVPGNVRVRCLLFEVLIEGTGIFSIHVDLGHDWELTAVVLSDPVFDMLLWMGLLTSKLVAREGNND